MRHQLRLLLLHQLLHALCLPGEGPAGHGAREGALTWAARRTPVLSCHQLLSQQEAILGGAGGRRLWLDFPLFRLCCLWLGFPSAFSCSRGDAERCHLSALVLVGN